MRALSITISLILCLLISQGVLGFSLDSLFGENVDFPSRNRIVRARAKQNLPVECSSHQLRKIVASKSFSEVQKYFNYCDQLVNGPSALSLGVMLTLEKPAFEKPNRYRKLKFTTAAGEKLEGLLAMKPAPTKLPLVIIRTGIYGRADFSFVNSAHILGYFENSPFHVLLLENASNEAFLKRNGTVRIGGLSGGSQILEATRQLKATEFGRAISEFHLVGFSLGAHDALYTNAMSTYDSLVKFKSVTALCPMLDLEPSVQSVFNNALLGTANGSYLKNMILHSWDGVPALRSVLPSINNMGRDTVTNAWINASIYQLANDRNPVPKPVSLKIRSTDDLLAHSRFAAYSDHIKTPTYIIQAQDDSITPYKINLGHFRKHLRSRPNSNIKTLTTNYGNHCLFSHVYGMDRISALLSGIVLKHSSFKERRAEINVVKEMQQLRPGNGAVVTNYEAKNLVWDRSRSRPMLEIEVDFFTPGGVSNRSAGGSGQCSRYRYNQAPSNCQVRYKAYILASKLGFSARPGTQEANAAVTRFNTLGVILDSNRRELIGSGYPPALISVPEKLLQRNYY